MADTIRAKSALATLLADNTSGAISPQDIRDFLESMHLQYGGMHLTTAAATTIGSQSTKSGVIDGNNYTKALGTTTAGDLRNFTMPSSNRLTYTGTPTVAVLLIAQIGLSSASSSQVIGFKWAKNGTVIDSTFVSRKTGTGGDVGASPMVALVTGVATNDYFELFIANETSASNATVEALNVTAIALFA